MTPGVNAWILDYPADRAWDGAADAGEVPADHADRTAVAGHVVALPLRSTPHGAAHDAAAAAGRAMILRELTAQGVDHPELVTVPETGYLKGALLEALDGEGGFHHGFGSWLKGMTFASGFVRGEKRATTLPSRPTRNFSKFQRMSPSTPSASATGVSTS